MVIEVWYDRLSNSWIIQRKDNEGNQIENADYVYSKKEALDYAKTYQKENPKAIIKVFKRNGELHKIR